MTRGTKVKDSRTTMLPPGGKGAIAEKAVEDEVGELELEDSSIY